MFAAMSALGGRFWAADVHLQADAVDGHAALLEPAHEGIDLVRLGAQPFRAVVVVDEERLGVGFVGQRERPASR